MQARHRLEMPAGGLWDWMPCLHLRVCSAEQALNYTRHPPVQHQNVCMGVCTDAARSLVSGPADLQCMQKHGEMSMMRIHRWPMLPVS